MGHPSLNAASGDGWQGDLSYSNLREGLQGCRARRRRRNWEQGPDSIPQHSISQPQLCQLPSLAGEFWEWKGTRLEAAEVGKRCPSSLTGGKEGATHQPKLQCSRRARLKSISKLSEGGKRCKMSELARAVPCLPQRGWPKATWKGGVPSTQLTQGRSFQSFLKLEKTTKLNREGQAALNTLHSFSHFRGFGRPLHVSLSLSLSVLRENIPFVQD